MTSRTRSGMLLTCVTAFANIGSECAKLVYIIDSSTEGWMYVTERFLSINYAHV